MDCTLTVSCSALSTEGGKGEGLTALSNEGVGRCLCLGLCLVEENKVLEEATGRTEEKERKGGRRGSGGKEEGVRRDDADRA